MKKRNIVHSALSLSLTAALCLSMAACGGTQTPADSAAASQPAAPSAAVQPSSAEQASAALPVKALNPKQVEENPYMAKSDANIHHDGYNTDSTDEILPLAIYPEINVSYETTNAHALDDDFGSGSIEVLVFQVAQVAAIYEGRRIKIAVDGRTDGIVLLVPSV